MLKNMKPSDHVIETHYELRYFYDKNGGFAFPCDADGHVTEGANLERLEWCRQNASLFKIAGKVFEYTTSYTIPATGICDCGEEIELHDQYLGACECPNCGKWYNLSGQELLPPSKWDLGDDDY